jgi:hypothetical protein
LLYHVRELLALHLVRELAHLGRRCSTIRVKVPVGINMPIDGSPTAAGKLHWRRGGIQNNAILPIAVLSGHSG